MDFLISGVHISLVYLMLLGLSVGIFGGFFGVGGSFLAGPGLFAVGMPMNFVVGTDLAHIVGKSVVATRKHWVRGNVDAKLGLIMAITTTAGTEVGAQVIQLLKRLGRVDIVVGSAFVLVLVSISMFMAWESLVTLRRRARDGRQNSRKDETAIDHISDRIQRIKLPPMISLPKSGIRQISLWVILLVGLVGGLLAGFLGGGAGYVRMPSLIYVLGVPTHVAVGTDLFEIIISAGYGTATHAVKGNVDILVALVMNTGAAVGAQIGVVLTQYFHGPRIRLAFVPLPLFGAGVMVYELLTGTHAG